MRSDKVLNKPTCLSAHGSLLLETGTVFSLYTSDRGILVRCYKLMAVPVERRIYFGQHHLSSTSFRFASHYQTLFHWLLLHNKNKYNVLYCFLNTSPCLGLWYLQGSCRWNDAFFFFKKNHISSSPHPPNPSRLIDRQPPLRYFSQSSSYIYAYSSSIRHRSHIP